MTRNTRTRDVMIPMYVVQFLVGTTNFALNPVILVYSESLGASLGLATMVASAYALVCVFTLMPFGVWSDRVGRNPFLYVASAIAFLGPLACYFAPTLGSFAASRLLHGLSYAMFLPVAWGLTMELAPRGGYAKAMGNMSAALFVGQVFGPAVGGFIDSAYNVRAVFIFAALVAIPCLPLTHLAVSHLRRLESPRPESRDNTAGRMTKRNLVSALVSSLVVGTVMGVATVIFPAYAQQNWRIDVTVVGIILSVSAVAQVLVRVFAGSVSDIRGRRNVILAGFVLAGIGIYGLSSGSVYWLLAAGVVLGGGIALVVPAGTALVSESVAPTMQGLGMGAYQTCVQLGLSLGVTALAFAAQASNFQTMYGITATISLVAAFGLFALIQGRRKMIGTASEGAPGQAPSVLSEPFSSPS